MKTLRCYNLPSVFRDALDAAVDPETGEISEAGRIVPGCELTVTQRIEIK